jgi:hypothetical protein
MSNTYKLTEKHQLTVQNLELINQINQKTGKELRVERDELNPYFINSYNSNYGLANAMSDQNGTISELEQKDGFYVMLSEKNIQRLLRELELGESKEKIYYRKVTQFAWNDYKSSENDEEAKNQLERYNYNKACETLSNKTQAKALSDRWFSLQETNSKATPSLWNSGEGQIQVLTELKEVLENYLNN